MSNKTVKTKLTKRQTIFAREIAKGNTQRQACIIAYPNAKKWKIQSVDVRANALMKNVAVKDALQKLNIAEQKEVLCTKEKITKMIINLIDSAEEDQERIKQSHENQLKIKQQRITNLEKQWLLAETDKEHLQIEYKLLKAKEEILNHQKKSVMKAELMNTVFKGIDMLIKMYGWNNCNIEETKKTY